MRTSCPASPSRQNEASIFYTPDPLRKVADRPDFDPCFAFIPGIAEDRAEVPAALWSFRRLFLAHASGTGWVIGVDVTMRRGDMPGFFVRLVINMLGLLLASKLVAGVEISGLGTCIAAALLLGVVNSLVRPIAILLTLPFTIITLGLFLLVINAAMLGIVAWLLEGFLLAGWGAAFFGALIVSLTSWVGSWYIGPDANVEILVIEERRGR